MIGIRAQPLGTWLRSDRRSFLIVGLTAGAVFALAKIGFLMQGIGAGALIGQAAFEGEAPRPTLEAAMPWSDTLPEPAAGPEDTAPPSAADPAPGTTVGTTVTPASSRGMALRLDPTTLTRSEVDALHELVARRTELEERERQLDLRAALLETAELKLDQQLERLAQLHTEIQALIDQHKLSEEAKLASLVKIYETMKPKAAAEIFDQLEMPVLLKVVERMRETKAAAVLARMNPDKAKRVTSELAKRTKLPPLDS